jgi:hypothetical protein
MFRYLLTFKTAFVNSKAISMWSIFPKKRFLASEI